MVIRKSEDCQAEPRNERDLQLVEALQVDLL